MNKVIALFRQIKAWITWIFLGFYRFIKTHWGLFVWLFLGFLTAGYLVRYFVNVSAINFFRVLTIYILWLAIFYVYFAAKNSNWLNKHQAFLVVIAIILPIWLFFLQNSIETVNYEVFLKEENNRNSSHLGSVINDLSSGPDTVFWRDFSIRSYIEFWDYIHLNKSQECKDLYADLTIRLGILNNIEKMRQELILVPNDLHKKMLEVASNTKPVLDSVIGKCQSL